MKVNDIISMVSIINYGLDFQEPNICKVCGQWALIEDADGNMVTVKDYCCDGCDHSGE